MFCTHSPMQNDVDKVRTRRKNPHIPVSYSFCCSILKIQAVQHLIHTSTRRTEPRREICNERKKKQGKNSIHFNISRSLERFGATAKTSLFHHLASKFQVVNPVLWWSFAIWMYNDTHCLMKKNISSLWSPNQTPFFLHYVYIAREKQSQPERAFRGSFVWHTIPVLCVFSVIMGVGLWRSRCVRCASNCNLLSTTT